MDSKRKDLFCRGKSACRMRVSCNESICLSDQFITLIVHNGKNMMSEAEIKFNGQISAYLFC